MNCEVDNKHLTQVLEVFGFQKVIGVEQIKSGNINCTYLVVNDTGDQQKKYILQRINVHVFKNPQKVMENIEAVTSHLKKKYTKKYGSYDRRCLVMVHTKDGQPYFESEELGFWRCMEFIEDATAYDQVEELSHFESAGAAFGEFQRLLADYDAKSLYETIPNFHNTMVRYETFVADVQKDIANRVQDVAEEVQSILERKELAEYVVNLLEQQMIPLRVTHNDTKLNNIMIDNATGEGICVIDLDTIMPGTALFDFGDAIRFGANHTYEDDSNLENVYLDLQLFEAFTKGFVEKTNGFLTKEEIKALPIGALVITFEQAMRFLNDYINGDTYFKVLYPEHNLVRARNQIQLFKDMEEKFEAMQEIVAKYCVKVA